MVRACPALEAADDARAMHLAAWLRTILASVLADAARYYGRDGFLIDSGGSHDRAFLPAAASPGRLVLAVLPRPRRR